MKIDTTALQMLPSPIPCKKEGELYLVVNLADNPIDRGYAQSMNGHSVFGGPCDGLLPAPLTRLIAASCSLQSERGYFW